MAKKKASGGGKKKEPMTEEELVAHEKSLKKYRDLDEMLKVPEGSVEWACFHLKWKAIITPAPTER